jgi:hypothetical protein
MFSSGGEIWRRCRRGEVDPNRCNMGGVNWGIGEVRGSVLFDLAALNKVEVLPWDTWGHMKEAYKSETGAAYDELLDLVSATIIEDDLSATNAIYATSQDLQVPSSLLPTSSS